MDALAALLPPFLRRRKRSAAEEEEAQLRAALMACSRADAADKFLEQRAENVQLRADKVQLRDANGALTQRVAELERAGARGDAVAAAAREAVRDELQRAAAAQSEAVAAAAREAVRDELQRAVAAQSDAVAAAASEAVRDELAARPAKVARCAAPSDCETGSGHDVGAAAGGGEETGHPAQPEDDAADTCIDDVLGTVALLCSDNADVRAAARTRLLALTHSRVTEVQAAARAQLLSALQRAAHTADAAAVRAWLLALPAHELRALHLNAHAVSAHEPEVAAWSKDAQPLPVCALGSCCFLNLRPVPVDIVWVGLDRGEVAFCKSFSSLVRGIRPEPTV